MPIVIPLYVRGTYPETPCRVKKFIIFSRNPDFPYCEPAKIARQDCEKSFNLSMTELEVDSLINFSLFLHDRHMYFDFSHVLGRTPMDLETLVKYVVLIHFSAPHLMQVAFVPITGGPSAWNCQCMIERIHETR